MNYLPYLLFTSFVLYVFFGAYVYLLNPRAQANKLFLLVCLCYAIWAFSYTNIHSLPEKSEALFWYRISVPGKTFFSIFIVHFFLSFTGKKRRLKYPAYLLYTPAILFLAFEFSGRQVGIVDIYRQGSIWIEEYSPHDPINLMYYSWHGLLLLLSVGIIAEWRREARGKTEKKLSGILFLSAMPAVILTLSAHVVNLLYAPDMPNLAPIGGVIWVAGIWYVVSKYGFLSINPEIAFDSILKSMAEGLLLTDKNGTIKWVNRSAEKITGYPASEMINHSVDKLFSDKKEPAVFFISGNLNPQRDTVFLSRAGNPIPVMLNISEIEREDSILGHVVTFQDISARKKAEEKIRYISFHDSLTGLYNRSYVEEEMRRLDTRRQLPICIIMCDVNGLKDINDFYGHSAGDKLIMNAARAISSSCRQEDIIARWGGDEFIVFLPKTSLAAAEMIAGRIKANCKKAPGSPAPLSISTGTAIKESPERTISSVIKEADDLMYSNKLREKTENSPGIPENSRQKSILIVEDEDDFTEALSVRLSSFGYKIVAAKTPEEGMNLAKSLKPDIIFMDVMFPDEIDGYKATEIIKNDPVLEDTPVIIISGKSDQEDIRKGMNSGADHYLTKPLDSRNLLEILKAVSSL